MRRSDVEHITDISYGPFGERNLLDVYRRAFVTDRTRRLFVHFHGGGSQSGHKDREAQVVAVPAWRAAAGFV